MEQTTFKPISSGTQRVSIGHAVLDYVSQQTNMEFGQLQRFVLASDPLRSLQNLFNHNFSNNELLFRAITHTSFAHEFSHFSLKSNERLEFLGDSILGAIVSSILWENFPSLSEGELSRLRAALVNEESLAKMARCLGLQNTILLGRGEFSSKGNQKDAILSDAFEAVLGAIFLDSNFETAYASLLFASVVYRDIYGEDFFSLSKLEEFDAKTRLQEKTMAVYKSLPTYQARQLEDQSFSVDLYIADQLILSTENISKKKAERELAYRALKEKLYLNDKGEPLC